MNEEQYGPGADTKARPSMSLRNAVAWAMAIGFVGNALLFIVGMMVVRPAPPGIQLPLAERVLNALFLGGAVWHALFGPDLHSMVWLCSVVALNFMLYSGIVFIVEVVFILWRRRLHPANIDSQSLFR